MSLWQHYDKVITRMHADICRLMDTEKLIKALYKMLDDAILFLCWLERRSTHNGQRGPEHTWRCSMDTDKLVKALHKMLDDAEDEYRFEADAIISGVSYTGVSVSPWCSNEDHVYLHIAIPVKIYEVAAGAVTIALGDDACVTQYLSTITGKVVSMWWCDKEDWFADNLRDPYYGYMCVQMLVTSYDIFGG